MVITTTLRYVTQRSVLAVLASTIGVGLSSESAAQNAVPSVPIAGPVPEFKLSDIPLADGEQIVSATNGEGGAVIQYDGGNYTVIDSSSVPTAIAGEGYPVMPGMPSPSAGFPLTGHAGSGSCASGNCGAGHCGTCGQYGSRGSHGIHLGGRPRVGSGGNVCGPTCDPYYYVIADALYMKNDGVDNFVGVAPFTVSDYDYEFGGRVTVGSVPDCRSGHEFTVVVPRRWESESAIAGAGINSLLVADGVTVLAGDLSGFNNATAQFQRFEAEFLSAELNRTLIGWEVIKLLYGVRYIQYDEEYQYNSVNALPAAGSLLSETENRMVGAQIGVDMTYPLTCRLWSDLRARAGAYANFAENSFRMSNIDGAVPANNLLLISDDDDTELAGMFEISGGARYYVTNNFHLRAGGELWYLTQVATATDQFSNVISTSTGRELQVEDDVLMFGLSAGAEWKF